MNGRGSMILMFLAIVAVVGVTIVIMVDQPPPEPSYGVEILTKTIDDLSPGDSIAMGYTDRYIEEYNSEVDREVFLYALYKHDGEKTSTQVLTYKSKAISCNVYERHLLGSTYTYYVDPTTGITYKWNYTVMSQWSEFILDNTNLDLTKTADEQTVTAGSFYVYQQYMPSKETMVYASGHREYNMTSYNPDEAIGSMRVISDLSVTSGYVTSTIGYLTGDGRVEISESHNIITRADFMSNAEYESLIQYFEEQGYSITYGDVEKDVIDTMYGTRKVTIQSLTCTLGNELVDVEVTYGHYGVVYYISIRTVAETIEEGVVVGIVKESSRYYTYDANFIITVE